jgi:hypothetical protein
VIFPFLLLLLAHLSGAAFGLSAASSSNTHTNINVPAVPVPVVPARLLVLDTLVPGQRLRLDADCVDVPTSFRELCQTSTDPLIVVGRQGLSLHSRGVQVFLVEPDSEQAQDSSGTLSLAATGRIVDICDAGQDEGSRWAGRQGTVTFLPFLEDDDLALSPNDSKNGGTNITPEQIRSASESLKKLFLEWEQLVRNTNRERFPGHLDGVFRDLGDMPEPPNARALWIAGMINPLPALGVALEIRPSVLTARSTERRLTMVDQGLRDSIARLQTLGPIENIS